LTRIALVLCAALATLGTGAAAGAQSSTALARPSGSVVGTAPTADETTLAIGDGASGARAANSAAGSNTFSYFLRMVVVLALVVAAIYGVYRLMRRASRPKREDDASLKLLASRSLGPGKSVHVLGLGTKAYLVGASESSVSLIAQLDDKELVDGLFLKAAQNPPKEGSARDFGEILGSLLGPKKKGQPKGGSSGDFLAGQRDRLTRL
jgi:flagellar protein FliO/FliZ